MANDHEFSQLNMRVPSELRGYYDTLADEQGMKTHPYIIQVLENMVDKGFLEIGREQFMANLEQEHQAERERYSALYDRLEAGAAQSEEVPLQ